MRMPRLPLLTHPLLWRFLGVVALSCVLWMLGPLLTLNDSRPLEPALHRQIAIVLLFLLWILFQLLPSFYRAWVNRRLLTALARSDDQAVPEKQAINELLTDSFNQAAARLKRTHFGREKNGSWLERLNANYLYQLPWYMVIGAPGAGKTTALLNAGLDFPLTNSQGNAAIRGVGGTRHCDWWFTRQAVLIDTAGRYALQESQRIRDASEWKTFIQLLRRYRGRQPINGVIVTVSVADLLGDSAEAQLTHAHALRLRLEELWQQTGIQFPVYIMVTKTDLLKGFMSYHAGLDKAQRNRIFGFTFPLQHSRVQRDEWQNDFSQQFAAIERELLSQLPDHMARERDLKQRADSFLLPQEFATLKPLLSDFMQVLLSGGDGEPCWWIRGLFFTSGTQEGLPFDRIMGELNRKLQLVQEDRQRLSSWDSVNRDSPIPANKSQSFFIRDLLNELVFRESGLAGSNRRWESRNQWLHWIGYGAVAGALLVTSCLWLVSFSQNQRYLADVETRLPALSQQNETVMQQSADDLFALLPFLNTLVRLPLSDRFSLDSPPLTMRAGLYRGNQISSAAWVLYQNALKSLLLPRVAQNITRLLREDKNNDAIYSRNALRAYQMLYQPRNYDGTFLRSWLMQNLQLTLPKNVSARQLQQLDWHLSQLLDQQIQSSPYAKDNALMMRKLAENLKNAGTDMPSLTLAPAVLTQPEEE